MKSKGWIEWIGLLILLLLPACSASPVLVKDPIDVEANLPDDYLALLNELRSTGAEVASNGQIRQALFDVTAESLTVNGDSVQIFIFENELSRRAAQESISENARTVDGEDPHWVSTPYFWSRGRMLALYVGESPSVLSSMSLVFGEPVIKPGRILIPPGLDRREIG